MPSLEQKIVFDWIRELFNKQREELHSRHGHSVRARKDQLRKLRHWIVDNKNSIRQALYDDFQKPAVEVDATEIFPVLDEINLALSKLDQWAKPKKIDAPITMLGTWSSVHYEPKGVCLIIAPWNYPFNLCIGPLVSALAAGNHVIMKPSEITENTSSLIKRLCEEGFDESAVAVCEGNAEVAQALLQLPFDHIFFTGSPKVGKLVMKAASDNLTSVTLELGGKSPVIVAPSAALSTSARRIAVAKFINTGQTCIAPDYVAVHKSVAKEFIKALETQVESLFAEKGKSIAESPHYARVVNAAHFDRLCGLLQDAIEKGANIAFGGEVNEVQRFMHPSILTDVSENMRVMQEEIFGPILPVLTYARLDEIIRYVNNRPKPLAIYYFGTNKAEMSQVKNETSSGGLCFNDCAIHFLHHNLPFGGVNNSGIGKSHGYHGFLAFSNEKAILRQNRWLTSVQFLYPPYTRRVKLVMNSLLRLFSR